MSRKRDKPYPSPHAHYSYPKRRRPQPPLFTAAYDPDQDPPGTRPTPPPAVVVIGLPSGCSVLDLKSRFEIYGPISRIRIDQDAVGFITFRTKSAAESAVSSALDPSFGITSDSKRVQVMWATGREGNGEIGAESEQRLSSKLLRAERPLSRHGRGVRGNKVSSTIVGSTVAPPVGGGGGGGAAAAIIGREIVVYDDLI